jgi:VIT1/CCC1 family predicted Fe2+/Mn2+ transporter
MTAAPEHLHTPEAIARRLDHAPDRSYVRDWVYGGIDGAVTTFAVAAGAAGAGLPGGVVVTLGIVNLVADGFSMAASNFSGTRAEEEELRLAEAIERRHVRTDPDGEREEIRQIFARKGFSGADLERAVGVITADADRWIRTMLVDEYGLALEVRSPLLAAASTFAAFAICGLVPILPYVVALGDPLGASCAGTALIFFGIGSARSRWSVRAWWRSGLETLGIGSAAAALAYGAGRIVGALTGVAG